MPDQQTDISNATNDLIQQLNQGHFEAVIKKASKLLKQNPNSFLIWNIFGAANKSAGDIDGALRAFKKTTSLNPKYADGFNNLGVMLYETGEITKAIQAYQKALSIKPTYPDALNNLGNAFFKQQNWKEAIVAFKDAIAIKPDYAEAFYNFGNTLYAQSNWASAITKYKEAISIRPRYAEAFIGMGNAHRQLEEYEEARAAFRIAISIRPNDEIAKHMIAALEGQTNAKAPAKYVEDLFDEYASNFENSLLYDLDYKTPQVLAEILGQQSKSKTLGKVLDLGCGTGLVGEELRGTCDYLEGIDLSQSMLDLALSKNVYDKLSKCEIIEYLNHKNLEFDYFIAADVFVYFGDLSEVFEIIKSKSKHTAKLIFTTEHSVGPDYFLQKTGRYSHSKRYVELLCNKFGWQISHFSKFDLRKEKQNYIEGALYVVDFSSE